MFRRAKKICRDVFDLCAIVLEDLVEEAAGESRAELQERLRDAAQRSAELAVKNAALEDKVDELRFNGPTLYRDEVDAIDWALRQLGIRIATEASPDIEEDRRNARALLGLLDRCDQMPVTSEELGKMAKDAFDEHTAKAWNDVGKDVDEDPYEGSFREAADNEGARIARGDDDE